MTSPRPDELQSLQNVEPRDDFPSLNKNRTVMRRPEFDSVLLATCSSTSLLCKRFSTQCIGFFHGRASWKESVASNHCYRHRECVSSLCCTPCPAALMATPSICSVVAERRTAHSFILVRLKPLLPATPSVWPAAIWTELLMPSVVQKSVVQERTSYSVCDGTLFIAISIFKSIVTNVFIRGERFCL